MIEGARNDPHFQSRLRVMDIDEHDSWHPFCCLLPRLLSRFAVVFLSCFSFLVLVRGMLLALGCFGIDGQIVVIY